MRSKSIFQQTLSFLFVGVMLTFGLKIGYNNIFIISFFGLSVIYSLIYKPKINFRNPVFIFFVLWFLLNLLSAMLSHNQIEAWRKMEVRLMFLLIPFPILVLANFRNKIDKSLVLFSFGMVFLTLILLFLNLIKFIKTGTCQQCFFHDFTAIYRQHAVYFSVLLLIAVILILEIPLGLKKLSSNQTKFVKYLSISILSLGLFFAASKIILFLWLIFLLYYIFFKNHQPQLKLSFLLLIILGGIAFYSSETLQSRFLDGLNIANTNYELENRSFTYDEKSNISDMELRLLFAKIGLTHLKDDGKIWTGYGIGDQQDWFDYHLMRYNLAPNWYENHNVHNQYLDNLLNFGIFGFIFFLLFMVYILSLAWKNQQKFPLYILLVFSFAFLFEVYLTRNKGIVFFVFWVMILYTFYLNPTQQLKVQKNEDLEKIT